MSMAYDDLFSKSSPTSPFQNFKEYFRSPSVHPSSFTPSRKRSIINKFWVHLRLEERDSIENYQDWFMSLEKQLQTLHPHAWKFAAREWDEMLSIIGSLRDNRGIAKSAIIANISLEGHRDFDDFAVRCTVELAIRIWLGINVRSPGLSVGPLNPRETRCCWRDDESLDRMISEQFTRDTSIIKTEDMTFDTSLTAVNLHRICRIRVRWTNNLLDHLSLKGDTGNRYLSIYRHKICLVNHLNGPEPTIVPAEILDEAIRTLELLFPFGDGRTEAFLRRERVEMWPTPPKRRRRETELDEFSYWRDKLAVLCRKLNGPPETVRQTLSDTRNISQFTTIWFAILGVFFLTILFGVLSTAYSIKQYGIALKAYDLALAQACLNSSAELSKFCA